MRFRKKRVQPLTNYRLAAESIANPSPEVGEPTLTVGQIVDQLGSLAPDAAAMNERIRHWTREGLLRPVDQHHAGTGKHRRYDADASLDTAVLNALATAGLQVVSRPYVKTILAEARKALQNFRRDVSAGRKKQGIFLVISHARSGAEPKVYVREGVVNSDALTEVAIVINLSKLFTHVPVRA